MVAFGGGRVMPLVAFLGRLESIVDDASRLGHREWLAVVFASPSRAARSEWLGFTFSHGVVRSRFPWCKGRSRGPHSLACAFVSVGNLCKMEDGI
jgi:hypothetical protein